MKKKKLTFYLLITLAIGIAITCVIKYRSHTDTPQLENIWVQATPIKEGKLPLTAHAIGALTARSIEISPEIAGHVESILFKDGSFVKKGSPLIQLDNAIYQAKFTSAKAQLTYSENDFKRNVLLGKQGAVTQQAIDQAEADFKEKQANAQENEVMMRKMLLTAPFDGVVGKSKVFHGDYVNTGQSVVTLTDTKHLRVEYNVPEKYLPLLTRGQTVTITAAAYPDKVFVGKVTFIAPTINIDNRSVSLYAEVPNEDNLLAAGMLVNVSHDLGTQERVLMVPARSLIPILDGQQVFKIVDGKAYAVTVLLGNRVGDNVQILQGLAPGDVIITDGHLKVRNNSPVKIKT